MFPNDVVRRLRDEADMAQRGLDFMDDPELAEETRENIALLREAAREIERLRNHFVSRA